MQKILVTLALNLFLVLFATVPASAKNTKPSAELVAKCKTFVLGLGGKGAVGVEYNAKVRQQAAAAGCKARHVKDGGGRPA